MFSFDVVRWQLPIKADPGSWGYGTSLVAVPGTTSIVLSLPTGGPRTPWCIADLTSGEIIRGTGMPGSLRAMVFPPAESGDQRPWVLGAFGLARIQLGPRPGVTDLVRKGIGKYQATLVDVDCDLLGVGHHLGRSLVLVSKSDGSPVKRIKVAGPGIAYPLPDGRLRILGFHYAQASDVDTSRRRVAARHPLPYGAGARHIGDSVIALQGDRLDTRVVDDIQDTEPDAVVVVGVGALDPTDAAETLGWRVAPRQVAVMDAATLDLRHCAPAPPDAVEILGVDRDGRVVVSTRYGFALLDSTTLTVIATHDQTRPISGAVLSTGHNMVGLLGGDRTEDGIYAVRW